LLTGSPPGGRKRSREEKGKKKGSKGRKRGREPFMENAIAEPAITTDGVASTVLCGMTFPQKKKGSGAF
jgi:hypothetical protein